MGEDFTRRQARPWTVDTATVPEMRAFLRKVRRYNPRAYDEFVSMGDLSELEGFHIGRADLLDPNFMSEDALSEAELMRRAVEPAPPEAAVQLELPLATSPKPHRAPDMTPPYMKEERNVPTRRDRRLLRSFGFARWVFDLVSSLAPKRLSNEEIGDALEDMAAKARAGRGPVWVYLKALSVLVWFGFNVIREWNQAKLGQPKAAPKPAPIPAPVARAAPEATQPPSEFDVHMLAPDLLEGLGVVSVFTAGTDHVSTVVLSVNPSTSLATIHTIAGRVKAAWPMVEVAIFDDVPENSKPVRYSTMKTAPTAARGARTYLAMPASGLDLD